MCVVGIACGMQRMLGPAYSAFYNQYCNFGFTHPGANCVSEAGMPRELHPNLNNLNLKRVR